MVKCLGCTDLKVSLGVIILLNKGSEQDSLKAAVRDRAVC